MTRDAKHPRDRFALSATAELRAVREGSRERLGNEIDRDIGLQSPPREETQNPCGLRFIEAGKIFCSSFIAQSQPIRGMNPQSCDRGGPTTHRALLVRKDSSDSSAFGLVERFEHTSRKQPLDDPLGVKL